MKRHISIFAFLLGAFAAVGLSAFAAGSGSDVMRLSPVGYRLGEAGGVTSYDPSVVTVTPGDTSIVSSNKPVTLTADLNRDYKVVRWQKFDVDPTVRTGVDPIEEFGEESGTVSVGFNPNVTWMYVTVVVKYDPVRTVKVGRSSFSKGTVSPEKTSYQKGDEVTLTAEPAEGYSFVRWSDGNADHVRTLTVSNDVDLTAYIEPDSSRVSFSAGAGAVLDVASKRVSYDSAYGELPVPVRDGLVFTGWADADGRAVTAKTTVDRSSDHTLYAQWEIPPESYTVVFDANGGTGTQTRVSQTFEVGVSQKLRINTFYKPGSVFVGWNQNEDAEEKQYSDEQIVQDLAPAGATLTLFAVWRAEKVAYTVHFDKNADDATGEMIDQQFAGGEEKPLSGCNFRRTGWTFLGWSTDSGAIEATYQDRGKVQDLTTEKELTLYAVWTRNPVYYINYMATDRDTEPWKSETVEQGKEYMLSGTNGLIRLGYTFAGWTNGTSKANYPASKKCTAQELAKMVGDGDTITLVADWKSITYTLAFDGNGGECNKDKMDLKYAEVYVLEFESDPPDFVPPGTNYVFVGLGTNREEAILIKPKEMAIKKWSPSVSNMTTVADSTVTLYAIWEGTVKINGADTNVVYGSKLQRPPDPVKTGYAFAGGWKTNGVLVTFPITVTGDFNLESEDKWTPIRYTVVFNGTDADGGAMEPQEFTYDVAQALTPNGFTRTGYTFANWTNEIGTIFADGAQVKNLATNDGEVVDLYATWTMNPHYYAVAFDGNGADGGSMATNRFECGKGGKLPATAFTRTGYAFGQWTNETATGMSPPLLGDGATFTEDLAPTNGTATLKALWTPNRYWVAFDGNGGVGSMAAQAFTYDAPQALTSNAFTRTGYGFAGWATNATATGMSPPLLADGAVVSNLTAVADATNTLFAAWTVLSYEISFDPAGGSAVGAQTNEYGKAVSAPTVPTRTGYQFTGWYRGEVKYEFGQPMPAESFVLTAHWAANGYKVRFNPGEGSGEMDDQDFTYDEPKDLAANRFAAPEMRVFDRWTNAVDSTTYADCETVCNLATGGEFVLYATWKDAPSYAVAFDGNGADGGSMATNRFECGKGGTLAKNRFEKTGYSFSSWTNATATGMSPPLLDDGATFMEDLAPTNGTATLKALWAPNRYWVAFDGNGGASSMTAQEFTYDAPQALTSNAFTRTGYGFAGWATNATATGMSPPLLADGAVVSNLTAVANATNTFFAAWTPNSYKVHYNPNGGSGSVVTQDFTYAQAQPLAQNTFDPPQSWMVFAGWSNATDKVVYNAGASVSNLTAEPDGQVDFYAIWADGSYTVRFDGNGGVGGMTPQVFAHGEKRSLAPNVFTLIGHSFKNWMSDDSSKSYMDQEEFTAPSTGGGETLRAVWTNNIYDCNFVERTEDNQSIGYGEKLGFLPNTPSKTGYVFCGWTTNGTDVVNLETFTMPDHDVMFVPKREPIEYTIAFDGNGTTAVAMSPTNVKYDVEIVLPSNTYERDGYEFVGWSADKNASDKTWSDGQKVLNLTNQTGTVTLFAVWQETGNPYSIALGLDSNFEVEVNPDGAWEIIGKATDKQGLRRLPTSPNGTLRVRVPSAGKLNFEFDVENIGEPLTVKFEDEAFDWPQDDATPEYEPDSAGWFEFSGTPSSGSVWTLKNFKWTAK